jgi:hypothetical protein
MFLTVVFRVTVKAAMRTETALSQLLVTQAIVIKQVSSPSTASRYVSQMGGVSAAPSNSLRFVFQVKAGKHNVRRKIFVPTYRLRQCVCPAVKLSIELE